MDKRFKEVLQDLLDRHTTNVVDDCLNVVFDARRDQYFREYALADEVIARLDSLKPIPGHGHFCDSASCDRQPVHNELLCEGHLAEHWKAEVQILARTLKHGHPIMVLDKDGVALTGRLWYESILGMTNKTMVIRVPNAGVWVRIPWNRIRDIKPGR